MKSSLNNYRIYFWLLIVIDALIYMFVLPGSEQFHFWAGFLLISIPVLAGLANSISSGAKLFAKQFWYVSATLIITIIAFFPSINNGFTNWDDPAYVLNNQLLKNFSLSAIFADTFKGMYQPLSVLSLAIDYKLAGLSEQFYHFTNVLLHCINTLLVYQLIVKIFLNYRLAFVSAILFGVASVHVESVVWITERKDMLFSMFFLLSMNTYSVYFKDGSKPSYVLSIAWFVCSLLSKPQGVALVPSLILVDYLLSDKHFYLRNLMNKIPFFLFAVLAGIGVIVFSEGQGMTVSFFDQLILAGFSFSSYLMKILVPINLSAIYPYPAVLGVIHYVGFAFAMVILGFTIYSFRKYKQIAFALLFFAFNIVLLLQFIPNTYTLMADRYAYLPSIGIYLLLGFLLEYISKNYKEYFKLAIGVLGVYVIILILVTHNRTKVWENSLTLWNNTLEQYPDIPEALNNRGLFYYINDNYDKALADFNKAVKVHENGYHGYINRSAIYTKTQKYDLALRDLNKAISLNDQISDAFLNRALVYEKMGETEKTLNDFNRAIRLDDRNVKAFISRGAIYLHQGKFQEAIKDLRKATELEPDDYLAWANKGLANVRLGNSNAAIVDFGKAISLNPQFPDAYSNRGNARLQSGNVGGAIDDFTKAIAIDAKMGIAYMNRGRAYARSGNNDRACSDFNKALLYGVEAAQLHLEKYCN